MAIQLQVLRFTCLLLLQSCCPITVSCTPCREGSVQLYNGTSPEEGIIEYCSDGFWKAVCDTNWNYQNSFVACRQLGLPATAAVPHLRMYHPFPLGLYFNCLGNESSLADCRATRTLSCNIDNTAGVQCAGEMIAGCTDGGIRLIGGRLTESEGRVEICSNGVWGTVYDGGSWDNRDATVICRQLGYSMAISYSGGLLGNGTGPILYAYLNCTGNETALSECVTTQSIPFGTQHFSDAGVRCLNASHSNCSDGAIRLVNGTTFLEGRVELCYNGIWGSVCDNAWDNVDAAVVCRQLGFPRDSVIAVNGSYFGDGEGPYLLSDTVCTKYRNRLLHCSRQRGVHEYTSECSPGHSAGVICEEICSHGDIRLKYGNLPQVCVNGIWSHICKEAINTSAISRTLCKQLLGVEELESFHVETCSYSARYSRPPSVLYDVSCSEQSRYVTQDCIFNVSQSIEITPSRRCYSVLSLACIPLANCKEGAVRLVDRRSPLEGRVEVCVSGFWGVLATAQIRSYYSFPKMPKDICKQLGLPWEWALPSGGFSGSYPLLSSCTSGDEHCYRPSCGRSSGYGVICQGNTSKPRECKNFDVRLVNGSDKTEGRLELCANGYWSNVCIDYYYEYSIYNLVASYWNDHAANLVCRKLGFPTEVTLNNDNGSPYGSNPSLPLVTVDCGIWDAGYTPVVNDIAADCRILNRCSHKRSIVSVSCGERIYFSATVEVFPAQESYEIGTKVTLRCIPPPSFHWRSPYFRWHSTPAVGIPFARSNISFVIPAHSPALVNCYCSVHGGRHPFHYLLGRGRTTLKIKGVLQRSINEEHIQVQEQGSVHLQVEMLNINVTRLLSELTWYHNGAVIVPDQDERIILSNDNKTLTVNNFTSADAGVYRAQFNRISVEPYNQSCNDKLIPLLRNYPIFAPAIYCIGVNSCTYNDSMSLLRVSVQRLKFMNMSDAGGLSLETVGIAGTISREEFEHISLRWYVNRVSLSRSVEYEWRQYPTIGQRLTITDPDSEVPYGFTGRYEIALTVNLNEYLGDPHSTCQALYNSHLLVPYRRYSNIYHTSTYSLPLSWGFIDVIYNGINLYLDTAVATRDEGATLICQDSVRPSSMLSLIKNGQIVATSSRGMLEINSKNVNTNPFGVYTCQLNVSGEIFEETAFLKEQVSIRLMIEKENQSLCDYTTESIEEALFSKISTECQCDFSRDDFNDSSIDYEESGELTYKSTIEYSNSEGSETASVIVNRLASQAPFSLMVEGMPVRVTAVVLDCADCKSSPQSTILSPAEGSRLLVGGFTTGALVFIIVIILMIIIIIGARKYRHSRQSRADDESDNDKTGTLTSQSVPVCPIGNDKENVIELKEK